ncbi:uncharacterized protein LOC110906547 [Helianthus annuus]|uniref:uncharacterized protein LOC110906547 n=1 Tax=Helianthus annuus TaxID=4232 RepID=UPI000B901E7C|nr:uncharacterized protein LOC110906547 [Helianthus annuus]
MNKVQSQQWDSLPVGDIDSFEDLVSKFQVQFSQQRRHTKDRNELLHIRRRDNEIVESFIVRFNKESLAIPGITNDLACGAFLQGVNDDELLRTLYGRDGVPSTIDEILRTAKVYVTQEKTVAANHAANRKKEAQKSQDDREQWNSKGKNRGDRGSCSRNKSSSRSRSEYPNLSKTPAEILASENLKLNPPKPLKDTPNKDASKCCEYHKGSGHDTNDCYQLKKQIEYYVKTGKLAHLVRDIKQGPPPNREDADKGAGKRQRELNMVYADKGKGAKQSFSTLEPWMLATITVEPRFEDLHLTIDPLIISAVVGDYNMRRIMVDTGSSEDIISEHCFHRMQPEDKKLLESVHAPIKGFTGEKVDPIGQITFPVTFGLAPRERTILLTFLVVRAESYHNVIIGRFTLGKLDDVVSTARGFMKFPTPRGIATVYRDKVREVLDTKRYRQGPTGAIGPERWVLSTRHPEQTVTIGDSLFPEVKNNLKQLLRRNTDIFAFEHSDMTRIPRDKAEHRLAILSGIKPLDQGKRSMAPNRRDAVVKEVRKLVEAGILWETKYHTWVSNPVMVKKPDGTWRMRIDFKDLNKAYPKDAYPLPEMDFKVDSLVPFKYKCFLDAYKGYHQIKMSREDVEKTSFHTDIGIFCYTKMPFGLHNAGATYQRLMDKAFEKQIGRNLEVYVDDLVIKSMEEKQVLENIEETFQKLREYNIKLNPKKCSFGVEEGKFLGVVVTRDGFRANPEKITAITRMPSPRTLKEAQALNGRLVTINRFLARHAEKTLPFIKTLKDCLNKNNFKWTSEAEEALQDMKRFIEKLPMLTAPYPKELLKMYLAAAHNAVSAVLIVERDGKHTPIYYLSWVLAGPETRYPTLEKLAIELGALDIEYRKRTAIKGQVIADFLAEIPDGEVIQDLAVNDIPESSTARQTWKLYTDGSSSGKGAGAGLMLISPDEIKLMYAMRFDFECSNNEAEYEALLAGLRMAQSMGATRVDAYVDSLLVNNQVNETYEAKDETMAKYLAKTKELIASFDNVTLNHIHRGRNQIADALSKLATSGMEKEVKVETLQSPCIDSREVSAITAEEPCWKSYLGPLIRCVSPSEATYLIQEIHAGICGIHAGPRAVVAKIHNAGYYWPGMHEDAVGELRKCRSCQNYAPQTLRPKNNLIPVTAAWPFQKWAVDIVGPFPLAAGKLKYLIVAIDYFTKWVEAKPLAKITAENAKKFLWEHIVCRFGLPLYLVSDNGT